jgi:hypothetical protein
MIRIKDDLYVDANGDEYRLVRRYKLEKKSGYGETVLGHYPSLKFLIRAATERKLMELINASSDWQTVLDSITEWSESLKSPLVADLKEAIRQYENTLEKEEC